MLANMEIAIYFAKFGFDLQKVNFIMGKAKKIFGNVAVNNVK